MFHVKHHGSKNFFGEIDLGAKPERSSLAAEAV